MYTSHLDTGGSFVLCNINKIEEDFIFDKNAILKVYICLEKAICSI